LVRFFFVLSWFSFLFIFSFFGSVFLFSYCFVSFLRVFFLFVFCFFLLFRFFFLLFPFFSFSWATMRFFFSIFLFSYCFRFFHTNKLKNSTNHKFWTSDQLNKTISDHYTTQLFVTTYSYNSF
jgi:hypothetical protein